MLKFHLSILFIISSSVFSQNNKKLSIINTGVNMTVAILSVDSFCQVGDTIVALYKRDDMSYKDSTPYTNPNDFAVAGFTVWEGVKLAITLWGNDSTSEHKDGFLNNEVINWAMLKNNQYIPIQMIYKVGENNWQPNGISIVDSVKIGY